MEAQTHRERLIEAACHAQEQAADAHYFAHVAIKAGPRACAAQWQAEQARWADRAAGDVTRLIKAPAAWLDLDA